MAIIWNKNDRGFNGTETDWAGYVLEKIHDNNYRIMSDVWGSADHAIVWDEKSNSPKHITVNVYDMQPDGWHPAKIEVDATEEVKEKYLNWKVQREYESLLQNAEIAAREIQKECIAKVVKGKNGKGTVGKVVVIMDGSYGMGWRSRPMKKYAIATSDIQVDKPLRSGKVMKVYRDVVWAWACNVERVDVPAIDKEALLQTAQERVVRTYRAA